MSTLPLPEPPSDSERPGLLAPLRDVFIAPARAYAALAARPAWLPAFAVVFASSVVYLALAAPAVTHLAALATAGGKSHGASAADAASAAKVGLTNDLLVAALGPLAGWSITATLLATIARWKNQTTPYVAFFALCAVCSLPAALGNIIEGIGVALRGAHGIATWKALAAALPDNLAVFAASRNDREVSFLSNFSFFEIWSTLLLAFGFVALAQVRPVTALLVTFGLDVVLALASTQLFSA